MSKYHRFLAGPEEDDQVLFNDELPHAGQRSNQMFPPSVSFSLTDLINISTGCCSLPVSERSGLHDGVQGASRAEQVCHDTLICTERSTPPSSNMCDLLCRSHDAMDSFYDYIWDVTILEYLTRILVIHLLGGKPSSTMLTLKLVI